MHVIYMHIHRSCKLSLSGMVTQVALQVKTNWREAALVTCGHAQPACVISAAVAAAARGRSAPARAGAARLGTGPRTAPTRKPQPRPPVAHPAVTQHRPPGMRAGRPQPMRRRRACNCSCRPALSQPVPWQVGTVTDQSVKLAYC